MSKKLIRVVIIFILLVSTSLLIGCNLKFLARPYIEEQNKEKIERDKEFMEMQNKAREKLIPDKFKGN